MFLLLKRYSIQQRLTFIIMAISTISVLLTSFSISVIGVYNLRASIVEDMEISATLIGDRNTAALLFNDNVLADKNLSVFNVQHPVQQACLYDQQGKVFAHYVKKDTKQKCPKDLTSRDIISDHNIELMKPIINMQDKIGHIYIESSLEKIYNYVDKQTQIALIVVLAALVVSYLLALYLQRSISRPILHLADTAKQISSQKDYTIRATHHMSTDKNTHNELVILTDSFNDMLSQIEQRSEQLTQQNTELELAKDVAESANRSKSYFLANISHELRTPLNAIIGFSSILMHQLFGSMGDQKYVDYAKDIHESGAHLLDIINDILDLSKAEAGKLTLNYEEVRINKTINKVLTIINERATQADVKIISDVPKMIPPLVADRLRFIQILLNILSNSVKFTPAGGQISLKIDPIKQKNVISDFVITIEDNGIGMEEADIDKAFQRFGQVDSGLDRKYEGTGLGLPLTKKLVELHHGTIIIKSAPGEGTLVTISLPAQPPVGVDYIAID